VEIGEGTEGGIWKIERGIHNRASFGNTRPRQENTSRSRCIGLYNRRSIVDKVWG